MIIKETLDRFIRHYSDTHLIRKIGTDEVYSEAVDLPDTGYEYEETDMPINFGTSSKSEELTVLIAAAKTAIRAEYPD